MGKWEWRARQRSGQVGHREAKGLHSKCGDDKLLRPEYEAGGWRVLFLRIVRFQDLLSSSHEPCPTS